MEAKTDFRVDAKAILIDQSDNVATALADLQENDKITVTTSVSQMVIDIKIPIPFGHKFAVTNIHQGEDIMKYGEIIGRATKDINTGEHAHIQNIESLRGRGDKEV